MGYIGTTANRLKLQTCTAYLQKNQINVFLLFSAACMTAVKAMCYYKSLFNYFKKPLNGLMLQGVIPYSTTCKMLNVNMLPCHLSHIRDHSPFYPAHREDYVMDSLTVPFHCNGYICSREYFHMSLLHIASQSIPCSNDAYMSSAH